MKVRRRFLGDLHVVEHGCGTADGAAATRGEGVGGQKKPININNFSGLSQEWVGVNFVYVLPFFLAAKKGTYKEYSQKISGKCRPNNTCKHQQNYYSKRSSRKR